LLTVAAVGEDLEVEVSAVAVATVVVVEAFMVVVLAVAVVSMGEVSVVVSTAVAFVVALWLPDTLEAESGAAVVESALAERTFQVGLQTLLA
jgi:site-specific recombinase